MKQLAQLNDGLACESIVNSSYPPDQKGKTTDGSTCLAHGDLAAGWLRRHARCDLLGTADRRVSHCLTWTQQCAAGASVKQGAARMVLPPHDANPPRSLYNQWTQSRDLHFIAHLVATFFDAVEGKGACHRSRGSTPHAPCRRATQGETEERTAIRPY